MLEDRHDDLDGTNERSDLGKGYRLGIDISPLSGGKLRSCKRYVVEPAGFRPGVGEQSDIQQAAADEVHPVSVRVEPRKRDVSGPDHQWHEVDPHRRHDRDREEEHHGGAMHREQLIVEVGTHQIVFRSGELGPHQCGVQASQDEKDERRDDVSLPDGFMIDTGQPSPEAGVLAPGPLELVVQALVHCRLPDSLHPCR
jgi:hypothetical protein